MVLLLGLSGSFWTCWNTVRFTVYKLCKSPISFAWEIRIYMNTICRGLDLCQPHNNNSVTHRSFVVLWLCAEEAVDLLHSCHLNLQVCQVPHNPVQVVGDLHRDIQRDWIMFLNIKIKFFLMIYNHPPGVLQSNWTESPDWLPFLPLSVYCVIYPVSSIM